MEKPINVCVTDDELRALRRRNEKLESLSDVGVALSGSFDIREILEKTRAAATGLVDGATIDVLYHGCDAINSRPLWCPAEPGDSNLKIADRLELISTPSASPPPGRLPLPITYRDRPLGVLFVEGEEPLESDTLRLLSTLTLQAATALGNIHLNQERIHFERLSAVGRMIGSVAHDLRSPLTALRGYAGMLANLDLDENERRAYGSYVTEECDRLDHMVEELLELTRGGTFERVPELLPLNPYLEAFADRLRTQFSERGVRVELSLEYPGAVLLDKPRMDRALWNVANNACQAMPDGGRLTIRTEARSDELVLSVEDEGTGIPETVQHRIFEPFFSYGKSTGIGLGMLIAKNIVQEHDGDVFVKSEPGAGTKVSFHLPLPSRVDEPTITAEAPRTQRFTEKKAE